MAKKNLKTLRSVGPSGLPRAALDKKKNFEFTIRWLYSEKAFPRETRKIGMSWIYMAFYSRPSRRLTLLKVAIGKKCPYRTFFLYLSFNKSSFGAWDGQIFAYLKNGKAASGLEKVRASVSTLSLWCWKKSSLWKICKMLLDVVHKVVVGFFLTHSEEA